MENFLPPESIDKYLRIDCVRIHAGTLTTEGVSITWLFRIQNTRFRLDYRGMEYAQFFFGMSGGFCSAQKHDPTGDPQLTYP
ncbi:hypothetical protein K443DRAFT_349904 [Laccaria amethystina LaAM-08-1]|uniref:Uncharacterized protein n=1 Tax=Laccaria amethystina LaAM-08-1 TaxID=1095629 RepID=A0A0C9X099_9AGAR|nr:hypothetical protein K443DRAFT_349904 [Laccaria amethystina LaAM-08-1]